MTDYQINICNKAISILRSCPYDSPYRRKREELAGNIEMQMWVGYPQYDDICIEKALEIINADAHTKNKF
jgi:hypothetical protein